MVLYRKKIEEWARAMPRFQFPLHREWFCIAETPSKPIAKEPSFSSLFIGNGSVSQQAVHCVPAQPAFSSLFIGNGSVSQTASVLKTRLRPFQFPLHREWFCIGAQESANVTGQSRFQFPLHREWFCIPVGAAPHHRAQDHFQFPLHREWFCIRNCYGWCW
mgnify:CR=1 FL=1